MPTKKFECHACADDQKDEPKKNRLRPCRLTIDAGSRLEPDKCPMGCSVCKWEMTATEGFIDTKK